MKLTKVKISNYRSFEAEQVIDIDELTAIIGNNSAGKTAALAALNTMFSQNSSERLLKRSDFHLPKDKKAEEIDYLSLYIEAVFSFEEVMSDNCEESSAIPTFYQSMIIDSPEGIPILRVRLVATWERSSNLEGSIESKICYITCPEDEEITEDNMRSANRKDLDNIRVIYVPAVRDPSKHLKNVSGTMIHQILGSVKWSESTKKDVQESINKLNEQFTSETGVSVLNNSISNQWKNYDSDLRYSNAVLRFNSTDIESSMKNSEIYFSPTVTEKEYTIDEMGDGLRSLFYISMVESILDVEESIVKEIGKKEEERAFSKIPPMLTVVAIEEPENHISPQLLGKLVNNLRSIAEKSNSQVMITSHSPAIVKRIDPENIRYFRMDEDNLFTVVKRIILPNKESKEQQYKYIKEAIYAYPELYFAKLVVLGEGDSEEIIISRYLEAYSGFIDNSGISIVPLGGRYVNHMWRLLSNLGIPYVTLLDLDREREGGGWGRIKYALIQLIETGVDKNRLLTLTDGTVLSEEILNTMHTADVCDLASMEGWINRLEEYNVFFSAPLDIDFLMLETIGERYIGSLEENEGPVIEILDDEGKNHRLNINKFDKSKYITEFNAKIDAGVRQTLKKEGGNGETYSIEQKEWMLWYSYFFLGRGKPTTHIGVLASMSDDELKNETPKVIQRLVDRSMLLLKRGE